MSDYTFEDFLGKNVVLRHWKYGTAIWTEAKLRKPKACAICGRGIEKGKFANAPITNKTFRSDRICHRCMSKLAPPREE